MSLGRSLIFSRICYHNYWADVTAIVKPIVDKASAGRIDITVSEEDTNNVDGEILIVIFDDPNQSVPNTISLFFGSQDVNGDRFVIDLAQPVNLDDSNLALDLSLGISHSYQGSDQYTELSINGSTGLTRSAGGQDDGEGENGALLTVGGLDDSHDNPSDAEETPSGNPTLDDGLYDLTSFVVHGTSSIDVFTQNPSKDDNLFFAALFHGGANIVAAAPPSPTPAKLCGPMDVAFIIDDTGSMGGAINNVKAELASLIAEIEAASGDDFQLSLLTFKDDVTVHNDLAADNKTDFQDNILALIANGGNGAPETSDEALNTAINGLDQADRPTGKQTGDFNGTWRSEAVKIIILVTDAPPAGFDDRYTIAEDDVNAHQRALEAADQGILISAIFVPTFGDYSGQVAVMQDYATTTAGLYIETDSDGSGTADAIEEIIDSCGTEAIDLSITKSNGQDTVEVSETLNYTITISNISAATPRKRPSPPTPLPIIGEGSYFPAILPLSHYWERGAGGEGQICGVRFVPFGL